MPLAVDAEPQHDEIPNATAASGDVRKERGAADPATGAPATDYDDDQEELRRRDRHSFIKLLRDGVQRRVSEQLDADAAEDAAAERRNSDGNSGSDDHQDPSLLLSRAKQRSRSRKSCGSGGAWQTLAWRDAYSTEPFFEATIDGKPLRIKQILQGELNGLGTGLTVWPAACVLLKHLDHRFAGNNQLENQFVLELGSGTGAVAIAAAMLGARRVVVTDMDMLLFLMQENVQLARETTTGALSHAIQVERYEWGAEPSEAIIAAPASSEQAYPDLILVSDCILPRLYPIEPLVAALDLLAKKHTTVLISFEYRYYELFDAKQRFWELMRAKGFVLRVLEDDEYHPRFKADDIEIWEISRQQY